LERIQQIRIASRDGLRRAQVTLRGLNELPAPAVLQAAEQLRQVMRDLDITDFIITTAEDPGRIES